MFVVIQDGLGDSRRIITVQRHATFREVLPRRIKYAFGITVANAAHFCGWNFFFSSSNNFTLREAS